MADVSIDASVSTSTARGMRSVVFATVTASTIVTGDSQTLGTSVALNIQGGTGAAQAQGQSFTATASYSCTKVVLHIAKIGTPTDNLILEVLTGSMTGTVIGTSNPVAGSTVGATHFDFDFTFGTSFSISSGTKYYLRVTRSGTRDTSNYYLLYYDNTNPLANGGTYTNTSGTWSGESASNDLHFQMFSNALVTYGYWFYIDAAGTFVYSKSTDGGATWGAAVTINSATTHVAYDVWFDQWTPGDTGTLIHTWYFDTTNDIVRWRTLDASSDTLGTERAAFTGASAVAGRGAFCSGTKTRSGYLYCAFDIDAGAEKGLVRSTDGGTTWSANLAATFIGATIDQCQLFPATGTGDDNDCWTIYQTAASDTLTMKMWDSSAAAAVQSSSFQTMIENATDLTGQIGFSGAIRNSDGALIVVSNSEFDTVTADMQVWTVTGVTASSLTGITAKTAITTNIDDNYYPSVCIDQNTNNIYVAYNGKRDGSEVLGTTTKIYYTKSTDGGTTWTSGDTAYQEGATAAAVQVWAPLSGPRFYVGWRVGTTLVGNAVNSVDVTPVAAVTPLPELILQPMVPATQPR